MEPRTDELPPIGRARELERLVGALDDAENGRGALVLLSGEPGIGKTRLAGELARTASARGFDVAWGRCWETGGAPAYWPWTQALGALVRDRSPGDLRRLLGARAADVAVVVPELRERLPDLPQRPPVEGDAAKFQLLTAIHAFVRAVAAERPLVLVLDDLHAADLSSLGVLELASRDLRGARLLVVGAYRDVEARRSAGVGEALARVAREGVSLELRRLDRAETAELAGRLGGAALAEPVYAASQGNPLFADEVLRLLLARGTERELPLPYGVRDAIRKRLALLSETTQTLLGAASVFGREFDRDGAALGAGLDCDATVAALREAAEAGVVAEVGPARWKFSHILVREALYRDLPHAEAVRLHHAAAEHAARDAAASPGALFAVAHHRLEAEDVAGAAVDAVAAATWALERQAYEDAVALLERVLGASGAARLEPPVRFELVLSLGLARIGAGDGRAGREHCAEAASIARARGDASGLARAALGYGTWITPGVVSAPLVSLLEEALAGLDPARLGERAALLARLSSAMQPAKDPRVPIALAKQAVTLARGTADRRLLATVLHGASSAMAVHGDPEERRELAVEHELLAEALGDRAQLLRARRRLVFAHLELAQLAAADAAIERYEALALELGRPQGLWPARLLRSLRAAMEGRFGDAEMLAVEAAALAQQAQDAEASPALVLSRQLRLFLQERHAEALAMRAELRAVMGRLSSPEEDALRIDLVSYGRAGTAADARATCDRAEDLLREAEPHGLGVMLLSAVAVADDRVRAADVYARLLPKRGRLVCGGAFSMTCDGPVSRLLGCLAATLERWDEADAHFTEALDQARTLGLVPIGARIQLDWAEALVRHGRAEDRVRARTLFERAGETGRALGMSGLVDGVSAGLAALDGAQRAAERATPRAVATPSSSALSLVQEGELWCARFEGRELRLRDTLGVRLLARLVERAGSEVHVLELTGSARDAGDAGELLDPDAVAAYRERIAALDEEIAEAERFHDAARTARRIEERDALATEISRAVGLGGRARRAGDAAERARTAVRRRLKDAMDRIGEQSPELGRHLDASVHTGTFCSYRPEGRRRRG